MTDGFIRKKVESLTLGEKLIKLRSQYRMSLLEISKATRIQVKYLEALESGDHRCLPAEVYVRGFLRSYARYLGLEENAFLKLYDKEKHIRTHLGKVDSVREHKEVVIGNVWVVTPRTVILISIGAILFGTFAYLFSEFRSFVAEPYLVIQSPISGSVTNEGSITISGKTDRGARITLNSEPVFVNNDGGFQEMLTLQPGPNTVRILATNRFEKTKETILFIENTSSPFVASDSNVSSDESAFDVVVGVNRPSLAITIEVDGVVIWNGPWPVEKQERLTVKESLKLTTSNPQATLIGLPDETLQAVDMAKTEETTMVYTRETLPTNQKIP